MMFVNYSRDILFKNDIHKKSRAEWLSDTNQIGGDFRRQSATFDNPARGCRNQDQPKKAVITFLYYCFLWCNF